jgi:predicted component of type VI protein secretion system
MARVESASQRLRAMLHRLKDCRYGGLHLDGEYLENFIAEIETTATLSSNQENALLRQIERRQDTGAVRDARRLAATQIPGTNVRLFPIAPRQRPQPGRDDGGDPA